LEPIAEGARAGATPVPAPISLRPYRANGFGLLVPQGWEDLTLHTLVERTESDFPHWLRVLVDAHPQASSAVEYGEAILRRAIETAPGCHVLRPAQKLELAVPAAHAELRWSPTDDLRIYQRYLFVLAGDAGFTLSAQMTKKTRITLGPVIDGILRSLRTPDPARGDPPPAPGLLRYRGDRFVLDHPENWIDRTTYTLAEPAERGFRRNLVIRRETLEEEPFTLKHLADAEMAGLVGAVPGIEVLDRAEIEVQDRKRAVRVFVRRPADGGAVEQAMLLAPRGKVLHVLTATYEAGADDRIRGGASAVLASFSFGSAAKGGA
jgi:hypothetical protein